MPTIYAKKIKLGELTIDDVPDLWKAQVKKLLKKMK